MDNLTPNTTPTPENNGNSRKKVLIGTLALVLLLSGTYYFGSSTGTQGSINRSRTPAKVAERRETPATTTPILRGKATQTTTTTITTTPVQDIAPIQTAPVTAATVDESTMNISRQWQGDDKYLNIIFFNDSTNGVQFNVKLPTYTGPDYGAVAHLQFCKNSNCTDIKTLNIQSMSMPDRTFMVSKDEVNTAVNTLGISNAEQGTIQYTINDTEGKILKSNALVYTFYDYNGKPATTSGETLFDKSTMSMSPFSISGGGGYSNNGTQIFYNKNVKSALSLRFNLPTYNLEAAPNAKTSYIQTLSLNVCDENGSQCQTIKTDTRTIFHKDEKFQTDPETYRRYVATISNDELVTLIQNSIEAYNGKFFFTYDIQDPTGTTLTTNRVELVISEKDKAEIMAPPIVGNIFDETTFTMNVEYNKALPAGQITYNADTKSAITFKFTQPAIKIGAPETQYMTTTILKFCDDSLSSCVDAKSFEGYVFSEGNSKKQMIIPDAEFDNLIATNPDKTTFLYSIKDPSGSTFYSVNSFKLIKQ